MKYTSTPVEFPVNIPVVLTLDTEPAKVQPKVKQGQWGDYNSYTYFAKGGKVFWPSDALHQELLNYHRGDVVTITKTQPVGQQKMTWVVQAGQVEGAQEVSNDYVANQQVILQKLHDIEEMLVNYINGKRPKADTAASVQEIQQGPKPSKDDLGF